MANLTVTIAVPCYNGAEYVGQTIESLLAQTRPADEILLIDDGSTDDSVAIIERYDGVRLIQHAGNKGLSQARNTAIAHTKTDILAFVDVDAQADPNLLEILLSGYTNPNIAGVGGQGIESNIQSLADQWRRLHASQGHGTVAKDVEFLYGLCMSFRLPPLQEVGGFNVDLRTNAEDFDIGLRLNNLGYRLHYLPHAKVYHQRTDNLDSLKRTMGTWISAGYRVRKMNHAEPWKQIAGAVRRLFTTPLYDMIVQRNPQLARLSWQMGLVKLRALRDVATE